MTLAFGGLFWFGFSYMNDTLTPSFTPENVRYLKTHCL